MGTELTKVAQEHWVARCDAERKAAEYKKQAEDSIPKELIKAIASQIGKDIVAYIEVMYPEAIKATSSTFKLSVRNSIHNAIVSISDLHDEPEIRKRLADNEAHRKVWVGMYRKMRRNKASRSNAKDAPCVRLTDESH